MGIESRQLQVAKEVDDVALLLVQLVGDIKAGKSAPEIASGVVAKLVDALAGVDKIGAEVESNRKAVLATIGYRVGELADAVLAPSAPSVVPVDAV
jgi:hypothetical protein